MAERTERRRCIVCPDAEHALAQSQRNADAQVSRRAGEARAHAQNCVACADGLARVAVGVDAARQCHGVEVCGRIRAARGTEDACDVESLAALLEEGARRVPKIVVRLDAASEHKLQSVAVDALKLAEARDHIGFQINWAEARRADKAGRGRTHALDGLGTIRDLFDVNSGSKVFRHESLLRYGGEPAGVMSSTGSGVLLESVEVPFERTTSS